MTTAVDVTIIRRDNGKGLSQDADILAELLRSDGYSVSFSDVALDTDHDRWRTVDDMPACEVSITLETVVPDIFDRARVNLFIPNPEWVRNGDLPFLKRFDRVLAKTGAGAEALDVHSTAVDYVGFTSRDYHVPSIPKERRFLHLAGSSPLKGTVRLVELWERHPEWPELLVLADSSVADPGSRAGNLAVLQSKPRDSADLTRWRNASAFHLCPSLTEGWGHYLVEGMGVAAVVVTTDAPPMSELVDSSRGVLVRHTGQPRDRHLATLWEFDTRAMEEAIERCAGMEPAELRHLGAAGRAWYVENDALFRRRFRSLMAGLLG